MSRADGEVTDDDVRRVVHAAEGLIPKNSNREVIHVIPRAYTVDGEGGITDPVGMAGMKQEVEALVVDGSKAALSNLVKCCELAGIEIEESLGGGKPKFDAQFETNVPGLFIAGALTGADSVIEAANQSYDIVQHIAKQ